MTKESNMKEMAEMAERETESAREKYQGKELLAYLEGLSRGVDVTMEIYERAKSHS